MIRGTAGDRLHQARPGRVPSALGRRSGWGRRRVVAARASSSSDAARQAIEDALKGAKNVLAANDKKEEPASGGGGGDAPKGPSDDGGDGGGGGWSRFQAAVFDWWESFQQAIDPWMKFLTSFLILISFHFVLLFLEQYAAGFFSALFRMNQKTVSSAPQEATVADPEGKLGASEKSVIGKYGSGTGDIP